MDARIFHRIQNRIDESFKTFGLKKYEYKVASTSITYQELEVEILRLMNLTKKNLFIGDKYHSFFVYGPTGNAKTEIVEQLAKQKDFIYHKLEIQKVPIEIMQGFPYLKDNKRWISSYPELARMTEEEYVKFKLSKFRENPSDPILVDALSGVIESLKNEYKRKFKKKVEIAQKVAKLAPSTILPPSGDDRCFVLHFDEFNKADADKMSAVMNLILTGELGGSADFDEEQGKSIKYKLPRRTVIIGTGNIKCQENVQNLNVISSMDTATSERWHRGCFLDYNAEAWLENFAEKPFEFKGETLETRIPPIILNFILDKTLDASDNKAAFLIPIISGSEEGSETERTTSPRAWTLVADAMILDGYKEWKSHPREPYDKDFPVTIEGISFNKYMENPENQIRLLSKQVYEFGLKGKQLVKEIISRYIYFAENRVLPDDILFAYKSVRKRIEKLKKKKGIILYLLLGVGYYVDSHKEDYDSQASAINVSTFIQDTDIPAEDLVAFIQTIDFSKNPKSKELHDLLFDISERYRNAYGGYYYTNEKEIK